MTKRLAIDVGGTFTDFVLFDEASGAVQIEKVLSHRVDEKAYFFSGLESLRVNPSDVQSIAYGTTTAINTILQRKGARVGLLTTCGYRDSLEICRGSRREVYNLLYKNPCPLVPRRHRREIRERLSYRGEVITPIDLDQVRQEVRFLLKEGCHCIAVVYLHAYRNPAHELATKTVVEEEAPGIFCSLSHEVAPEWREYERASTVVLNCYVAPQLRQHLDEVELGLAERGYSGSLALMQSTGGCTAAEKCRETPITTLESGPAGGVIAAVTLGHSTGRLNIIAADVGGTSFDVALILDGKPSEKSQTEIEYRPVLAPTLDITSIGAGGGSIAWVDTGGGLNVGPESAQADPGPACFGRGGQRATVTDAYVVLGVINPDFFLGNRMPLNVAAAERAILENVGHPLSLDAMAAADAVVRLATMNMVLAIRNITIEKGYDPREFSLVAYGGGGGMFAAYLARELEIRDVVIPKFPANFSAWGILNCDYRYDGVRHLLGFVDDAHLIRAVQMLRQLESDGLQSLHGWGYPSEGKTRTNWFLDIRYFGQEHTIRVPVARSDRLVSHTIRQQFEELHQFHYSHTYPTQPIELVNCRAIVTSAAKKPQMPALLRQEKPHTPNKAGRRVHFPGHGSVDSPIYDRELLREGDSIKGPAVIEEWTSTTVLLPGDEMVVDHIGNLNIRRHG